MTISENWESSKKSGAKTQFYSIQYFVTAQIPQKIHSKTFPKKLPNLLLNTENKPQTAALAKNTNKVFRIFSHNKFEWESHTDALKQIENEWMQKKEGIHLTTM